MRPDSNDEAPNKRQAKDKRHLGGGQQPAQAQNAMRDAAAPECIAEAHHVLLAAKQHSTRRRAAVGRAGRPHALEPLRDAVGLAVQVGGECELDVATWRTGSCAQL